MIILTQENIIFYLLFPIYHAGLHSSPSLDKVPPVTSLGNQIYSWYFQSGLLKPAPCHHLIQGASQTFFSLRRECLFLLWFLALVTNMEVTDAADHCVQPWPQRTETNPTRSAVWRGPRPSAAGTMLGATRHRRRPPWDPLPGPSLTHCTGCFSSGPHSLDLNSQFIEHVFKWHNQWCWWSQQWKYQYLWL